MPYGPGEGHVGLKKNVEFLRKHREDVGPDFPLMVDCYMSLNVSYTIEVVEACKTARIHDFIVSLPEGYHTELGEAGTRFSGGQARRVAVARALLKNAPLLILDEPTEGLDAVTEQELLAAIDRLMQGRSVLLITHRLTMLAQLVDNVAVIEEGCIVERGTVAQLIARDGPFRRLHDALGV